MMMWLVVFAIWIASGVYPCACGYNHFSRKYGITKRGESDDYCFCVWALLFGPANWVAVYSIDGFDYGPRFRRYKNHRDADIS
jgi:hypothetical protein